MSNEEKLILLNIGVIAGSLVAGVANDKLFSKVFTNKANKKLEKIDYTEEDYWKKRKKISTKNTIEAGTCSLTATLVECKLIEKVALKVAENLEY